MIDSIQQSVWQLLPSRKRAGQNGWISFNAPCCVHNGESADTRGRGGIRAESGKVSYHCFNCGFKTSYQPGRHLSYKFRKFLSWVGADDLTIRKMVIDAARLKDIIAPEDLNAIQEPEQEITFDARSLPSDAKEITEWVAYYDHKGIQTPIDLCNAIEYVASRQIDFTKYKFYWTPDTSHYLNKRIIFPYYYQGKLIGYNSRTFEVEQVRPKYYNNRPPECVFNIDMQRHDSQFVIVCEGEFDAMCVGGVSVGGTEVTEQQAEIIDRLQREVIVVPDADKSSHRLVSRAIELGWAVSFPIWFDTCKDINEAMIKYGKLFVLKAIIDAKETNKLKIELRKKKLNA